MEESTKMKCVLANTNFDGSLDGNAGKGGEERYGRRNRMKAGERGVRQGFICSILHNINYDTRGNGESPVGF